MIRPNKLFSRTFMQCFLSCLLILMMIFFSDFSFAQLGDRLSNPKILVEIEHPPGLGFKINKVAFNPATGNCSQQVTDEIITDFVNNKVEVIERENLKAILSEHNLNFTGYVDKNTAVSIGKILGPSALLTVKVLRCETEIKDNLYANEQMYDSKTKSYYYVKAYIARTRVYLKVSIQATDLTTGRIFTAKVLDYSPYKENKSYEGKPETPSEFDVQKYAFSYLTNDVHRMFFAWTEKSDLYFYDDQLGGLKETFKTLKAGNKQKAFEMALANLSAIKQIPNTNNKLLAHAYYNVGMMYFINSEYDSAINNFEETARLRPGGIINETLADCKKAKTLALEMQKVDENAASEAFKVQNEIDNNRNSEIANTIKNEDIITLTKKKLPTNLIIQKIKTSTCKFDTSTDALLKLSNEGVDEKVIIAMMEKK